LDAGAHVYAGVRASSRDACADLPVAAVIDLSDDKGLAAAGPFDFVADTVGGPVACKLFARRMPIAHRLPLTAIARAHRLMEQGGVGGKILLLP
jgi:NADPH:quinone reductase-like Zn-dependent oxidoreductase